MHPIRGERMGRQAQLIRRHGRLAAQPPRSELLKIVVGTRLHRRAFATHGDAHLQRYNFRWRNLNYSSGHPRTTTTPPHQ
jgi:hypothetical protein